MDEERTYLVKQVLPKVRAACLERQVGFSEIDLRWGVSVDESKNGATVEICLKEINRCRDFPPFFIGFLGERYGWVPKHDELAAYWEKHSKSDFTDPIKKAIERGISVTELEMELAVLGAGAAEKIANHALFCLRDKKLTGSLYADAKAASTKTREPDFYDDGQGKLKALKTRIRDSGFLGLDNYTTIEQFGDAIEKYLLEQLDVHFPADAVPTALERSNAAHQGFQFHRLQNFLPRVDVRETMIQAINQRIDAPSLGPILVTGPSGQGKSALMADLARHYQNQLKKEWRVIDHYIGADNANHLDGWVDRILQTLHPDIQDIAGDFPESPKDKIEALSTWISMAARRNNCRYLFILDALDQLSDGGKNLDILTPQTLGPDGILIASAANDTPARTSATNWQTFIEVPPLTDELRTQLIQDTLSRYRKNLPDELATKLARAKQSGSPLFLSLVLEELRVDARHETLAPVIDDILVQPDAEHLFLNIFLLDVDNGRKELPELAASFMALLGASRAGLSESELADLLAMPGDPIAEDTGKPRLPQVYLSKLLNNFAPFLLNKQGRRAPMHRIFGKAALEYYGTSPVIEHLYAHFSPGYGKGENGYNDRAASEAIHQITELAKLERSSLKQARKQLVQDIGYLPVPVKLHDDEANDGEKLILEALDLSMIVEKDQKQLTNHWAKAIGKLDADDAEKIGPSVRDFGSWLKYWARYPLALPVLESLMTQQESLRPKDHEEIANTYNALGLLYLDLARYEEAIPMFRRALAIYEKSLGSAHPAIATSLNNLGFVLQEQGDYAGAEPLYKRALAITEQWVGLDGLEYSGTATSLENLASLLKDQGDYAGAELCLRRALAILEKFLGPAHPDTAISLHNLAFLLNIKGDSADAETLYRRALTITEKSFGSVHPKLATTLNNLAELLSNSGDYTAAEPLHRRALAILEKFLGTEHPDTATSIVCIGALLHSQGDYTSAEPLHRRALAIREKFLGTEHPDTANSLDNLAGSLHGQGDYAGAESLHERALAIREKSLGTEHPDTAKSLNYLAGSLHSQGDYARAESLHRRALVIQEKSLGPDHPYTTTSLQCLAVLLRDSGKLGEAEPLHRQAVERHINMHGENSLAAAAAYSGLGALLKLKHELAEAEYYYRKALAIRVRELGVEAEPTKLVRKRLDELLEQINK